jgi:hypothetical protein
LEWEAEWGKHLKFLLKRKEQGKDPEPLRNMPVVPPGFDELLRHFRRLSFSRTYGMSSPNPIDFLSIDRYNQTIARLDLDFFLDVVQLLDSFYLEKASAKQKSEAKAAKKSK